MTPSGGTTTIGEPPDGASSGGEAPDLDGSTDGSPPDTSRRDGSTDSGDAASGGTSGGLCGGPLPRIGGIYRLDLHNHTTDHGCEPCGDPIREYDADGPGMLTVRSAPANPDGIGIEMLLETPDFALDFLGGEYATALSPYSFSEIYLGTDTNGPSLGSYWSPEFDGKLVTLYYHFVFGDHGYEAASVTIDTATGTVPLFGRAYHPGYSSTIYDQQALGTGAVLCRDEPSCTPGATRCHGADRQTCSARGKWTVTSTCTGATPYCSSNGCVATPPSCQGLAANCGPSKDDSCCVSPLVTGGDFYRLYDGVTKTPVDLTFKGRPATVSSFRLDKYEVTVGRFRSFVNAWNAGYRPSSGDGKHTHLNAGTGVRLSHTYTGATEPERGWQLPWSEFLPQDAAAWNAALDLNYYATWTPSPGVNETLPIQGLGWYEAAAFCAWDGGSLPTAAEWDYAYAGGSEQRVYPWSNPPGSTAVDETRRCAGDGTPKCVLPVGSYPGGNGRYGQADLHGSAVSEWQLDRANPRFPGSSPACIDCAFDELEGGRSNGRGAAATAFSRAYQGVRCARAP